MIEEVSINGLSGVYGTSIPNDFKPIVDQLFGKYKAEVKKSEPWLREKSTYITRQLIKKVVGIGEKAASAAAATYQATVPSPPSWTAELIDPVMEPVVDAAQAEAKRILKPYAIGGAALVLAALAGSFALGRVTKSCR